MIRANYFEQAPQVFQLLIQQEASLSEAFKATSNLTPAMLELIKLRVSQINQCAFCIDMHSTLAQEQGERVERLLGLNAWRDLPHYTPDEQVALAWAELITSGQSVDDQAYQRCEAVLGEQAIVFLTVAINAINAWNRIAKTFKPQIGSYR